MAELSPRRGRWLWMPAPVAPVLPPPLANHSHFGGE